MKMERRSIPIEDERKEKKEKVDLSGMSLNTIPSTSINWLLIAELDLSNNNLEFIPESLTARLLNAVTLDVHSNQLKNLPNSIGCLTKLKVLNVSGNMLEFLPKSIENCRALEELNANFNKLTKLPDTIGFELTNLRKLSVNSNKLAFLPFSTSHMTTLRVIDARLNCLRALPDNLENLINLQVLNISQNFQYLDALPYSVGLLMSLVELDVSYNQISALPDSIGCLKNLKKLRVEGNPLVSPPTEVMDQSIDVVKAYLSERMKGNASHSTKKRSWIRKLVKHKTFNGKATNNNRTSDQDGFLQSDYRSIDGLASPRYMGMFSPRRLFSPKSYLSR
ncbi:Plant intracellular Ras-group-related LRR protein 6 [Asimina triloba]